MLFSKLVFNCEYFNYNVLSLSELPCELSFDKYRINMKIELGLLVQQQVQRNCAFTLFYQSDSLAHNSKAT